jgi:uncharacterized protein YunC (DUF1805 family)
MNLDGIEQFRIDLKLPLLILRGSRGVLACGYLNLDTFNKTGDVAAVVTGVKTFDDMQESRVVGISKASEAAGLRAGMTGAEVLEIIR